MQWFMTIKKKMRSEVEEPLIVVCLLYTSADFFPRNSARVAEPFAALFS
jgi:hypothetical protein